MLLRQLLVRWRFGPRASLGRNPILGINGAYSERRFRQAWRDHLRIIVTGSGRRAWFAVCEQFQNGGADSSWISWGAAADLNQAHVTLAFGRLSQLVAVQVYQPPSATR